MTATFPQAPLDLRCELDLSSWTDISSYVYQRDGSSPPVTLTRGRQDETTTSPNPASAAFQLNNRDGRFSRLNPTGPYYGTLSKNTPVRFSVPAVGNFLRLENDATGYASAPDSVPLSITGNIDIRADIEPSSYVACVLASKWASATNQRSWVLMLNNDGTLQFWWSADGATSQGAASTLPIPPGRVAVRVTLNFSAGIVTFFTAPTMAGSFTQLGSKVTLNAAAVFDSTSPVVVGNNQLNSTLWTSSVYGALQGAVYEFQLLSGIGGTLVADPVFSAQAAGATSFSDAQSNTWTLAGTAEISSRDYRFHGEMSSLPKRWDKSGTDIWVPVAAGGILRRLNQGNQPPVASALKRAWLAKTGNLAPLGYWPMEDTAGVQCASALPGGNPMTCSAAPSLASNSSFACSAAIPTLNKVEFDATIDPYTLPVGGAAVTRFLMSVPSGTSAPDGSIIAQVTFRTGTVRTLTLRYRSGGGLALAGRDVTGAVLFDTGPVAFAVNGQNLWVSMELQIVSGNLQYSTTTLAPGNSTGLTFSATISGTVGTAKAIRLGPDNSISDIALGHLSFQDMWESLFDDFEPLFAWTGETAGNRYARLCAESNVPVRIYGPPAVSVPMGAQSIDTLVSLLQACEDTDRGQQYEPRTCLGLGYRTSASMTGQAPAVTLDYAQAHLGDDDLTPADDDLYTVNDVTVNDTGGSSARAVLNDGTPMSVSPPPVGVGEYANSFPVSVRSPLWQLDAEAGWILHAGTVDEERYPLIPLNLARPALSSLTTAIRGVDIGDYVAVVNPPAWQPPGVIKQLVWQVVEQLGGNWYKINFSGVPESPYETGVVFDPVYGRVDTDGASLADATVTSTDTTLTIATAAGNALWTTAAADFPFDVTMGGEQMTVTNVDGAPGNFLPDGDTRTFDASLSTWTGAGNCSLAHISSLTHSGPGAAALTCNNAANMSAAHCTAANILTQGIPCSPGDTIACAIWVLATSTTRNVQVGAQFYTSGGAAISTLSGAAVADSTSVWTKVTATVTAPATAAFCRLLVTVQSPALGEIHNIDDAYLADVTTGNAQRQTFTVTRSVNGVVKTHTSGEDIRLTFPTIVALA